MEKLIQDGNDVDSKLDQLDHRFVRGEDLSDLDLGDAAQNTGLLKQTIKKGAAIATVMKPWLKSEELGKPSEN